MKKKLIGKMQDETLYEILGIQKSNEAVFVDKNNFFTFNSKIATRLGLNSAILLNVIVRMHVFFESNNRLNDGWFPLSVNMVKEKSCLAKDAQRKGISKLIDLGIIETKILGIPASRNFKIFKDKIVEFIIE